MCTAAVLMCSLYSLAKRHPNVKLFRWMFIAWLAFKVPYIVLYMTALRTHYFIDFASGLCFGVLAFILAEYLSYFIDVLILGRRA